jgi:hypothetical protein
MFVLTIDQRDSRMGPDLAPETEEMLNRDLGDLLVRPFERTVGDELQAVTEQPRAVSDLVRRLAEAGRWWIGVGIGAGELGETSRLSRGPAFVNARHAVEAAKGSSGPVAVRAADAAAGRHAETALAALYEVVAERSAKMHEVAALRRAGRSGAEIADHLSISRQAVSERLRRGRVAREEGMAELAEHLLAEADAG